MKVGEHDDRFHRPPAPDPTWAETAWFGFADPERGLGGTLYPLFRHHFGVCALGVAVWDARALEPWRARYARRLWHVPIPDGDLDDLSIAGLTIRCLDPLERYHLTYSDGDRIAVDLEFGGILPVHAPLATPGRGHLDQPGRVVGSLRLGSEQIPIDCFEMRDRSWGPRDDLRTTRASYCYGIAGPEASFLVATMEVEGVERVITGFLVRDGEKQDVDGGTRSVLRRSDRGFPERVRIEATDAAGRRLEVEGTCISRLAEQATPGMFAWMSLTHWSGEGFDAHGQDQEVWSPDTWPLP